MKPTNIAKARAKKQAKMAAQKEAITTSKYNQANPEKTNTAGMDEFSKAKIEKLERDNLRQSNKTVYAEDAITGEKVKINEAQKANNAKIDRQINHQHEVYGELDGQPPSSKKGPFEKPSLVKNNKGLADVRELLIMAAMESARPGVAGEGSDTLPPDEQKKKNDANKRARALLAKRK